MHGLPILQKGGTIVKTEEMRILQLNLNHSQAAHELLKQSVFELNIDIAVISEPYYIFDSVKWIYDSSKTSAIWSTGTMPLQSTSTQQLGFTKATISGVVIYSCYIPPRYTIEEFGNIVYNIVSDACSESPVIITGDFNAWAVEWGCTRTNARGRVLLESLSTLNVVLMNRGGHPTFSTGQRSSVIDLAFASYGIANRTTWRISDIYTNSDHLAIIIDITRERGRTDLNNQPQRVLSWKAATFDRELFKLAIDDMLVEGTPETMAGQLAGHISRACDVSMVRRKNNNRRNPVYWWNEQIALLRSECVSARRLYSRTRGRPENELHRVQFKEKRKALKLAIRRSKRQCFVSICDELECNPWGLAYKLVTKKLKCLAPTAPTEEAILDKVVEYLFPRQEITSWDTFVPEIYEYPPVTYSEIQILIGKFADKKAPGLDGISNVVLKEAFKWKPQQFLALYNNCLRHGIFPSLFKQQRLVLVPKDGKPLEDPSSYRPLCMINTSGKLLESIICERLKICVEAAAGISDNQFGFRKSRSTVDAIQVVLKTASAAIRGKRWKNGTKEYCVMVTLDVKNAFNTAKWEVIVSALARLNIPQYLMAIVKDYFRTRMLIYDTDKGMKQYKVTGGVPQGSILGPLLWNVMYDGVLRLPLPQRVKIVGFADDIAILCVARELPEAVTITNASIATVRSWLTSVGLKLADHKTEAVLISSRKAREKIKLNIGSSCIETKPFLKYLGVIIDCRLSFIDHLKYVSEKSSRNIMALSRIMPNTGGPKYLQRKLLTGVVRSVILYASPIWAGALRLRSYGRIITPVYRLAALRVCSAFRTVSDEAAFVIAGMIPIDLLAKESGAVVQEIGYDDRRTLTLVEWQTRWSASDKGRWTNLLIPDVERWFLRKHGDVNFYLTQMLSGHGCFRSYLFRFGHDSDYFCPSCHPGVEENAEHVFFVCPRFEQDRLVLENMVGCTINPRNIIEIMLTSPENWGHVCSFVKSVLVELRRLEKIRRGSTE